VLFRSDAAFRSSKRGVFYRDDVRRSANAPERRTDDRAKSTKKRRQTTKTIDGRRRTTDDVERLAIAAAVISFGASLF
jgi:hypothetical protein